jgi:hemolysin activation/secretion protein
MGYENKELSMRAMQEVANKITDLYRQSGFITSRAILAPQKIEGGLLKIEIIEGKMGTIDVKGNKYYKASLIKRKIDLKPADAFNYNKLKSNLSNLNAYRDRNVQTVLTPGKEPGTTDLVLNVTDKLPVHVGVSYDNYGSRYLDKKRYQGTLTHNNLTGNDDIMTLTYQLAEGHHTYRLNSGRYFLPFSSKTGIGLYVSKSQLELGKEYADLHARGKSSIYSVFLTQNMISNDLTDLSADIGFDYKDSFNFENYTMTSKDRLRNGRLAMRFDHSDGMGRTIVNNEITQGFPDTMGALGEKESAFVTSREGAGAKFTKNLIDVLRLQRMPKNSTLLIKGQGQVSSHVLTSTEQYQLGGISNLRGFAPGEAVGDAGGSLTAEWSFPVYGLSKNWKSPLSKAYIYDALRLAVFYDCGKVNLRNPSADEHKTTTLSDYGIGARYDLPENFSARIDLAWPIDDETSDDSDFHTWFKISKDF